MKYLKDSCHYYKAFGKTKVLVVTDTSFCPGIEKEDFRDQVHYLFDKNIKTEKSTKAEFNKAYKKVLTELNKLQKS